MSYKAISFRLNLDDQEELCLYQAICSDAENYSTLAGCLKHALRAYYKTEKKDETLELIEKLIGQESNRIIKEIQNVSIIKADADSDKGLILPEQCNEIPQKIYDVFDMFE